MDHPNGHFLYQRVCLRVPDHFQAKKAHAKFEVAQLLENAPHTFNKINPLPTANVMKY